MRAWNYRQQGTRTPGMGRRFLAVSLLRLVQLGVPLSAIAVWRLEGAYLLHP